jgi:hypothetical protein
MNELMQALCFCSAIVSHPYPQLAHRSGDIWYTHERVGQGTHLLRLSSAPYIWDTDRFRDERYASFAHQFADQVCHGRYRLTDGERSSWPKIHPVYAKQFVFRCG